MKTIRWAICLIAIACLGVFAMAQTPTGTIQGVVTDNTGAAIPGASITIVETTTNTTHKTTTDSGGRFIVPFVDPGAYSVIAEAHGFKAAKQNNILVQVTETRPVDFELEIGAVTETVEVNSSDQSLDTDTSSMGQTVQSQTILELPDNGRNPFDFAMMVPGVNNEGDGSTPHIGGSRNSNNEQLIDGMTNITPENNVGNNISTYTPVEDSVQEVNVQTSVLPAEYGRFSGGAVSLITKSGGNQFHGSAFEFIQQGSLDANVFNYPGASSSGSKPNMQQSQSGGSVGGPIIKNRAFFFFDYEYENQLGGASESDMVPTDISAFSNGDFTSLFGSTTPVLYDPDTVAKNAQGVYVRQPFETGGKYNVIPSSRISPVAKAALSYFPKPNIPGAAVGQNNYSINANTTYKYWHLDSREDVNVTPKWHSFLRYSMNEEHNDYFSDYNDAASNGGYNGDIHGYTYSGSFNNTVTFSPKVLGEFRYGYSKQTANEVPVAGLFNPGALGFDSGFVAQASKQMEIFPHFNFGGANNGGFSDLGTLGYTGLQQDPLAQSINASLIKLAGAHTFKVGGEFRALRTNFYQFTYPSGTFYSDDSWTRQMPQTYDGSTGFSLASLMLGLPQSGYITDDPYYISTSQYVAFYGQDDWKVSPRLTLNIGLRYDFEIPRKEQSNQLSFWDPTAVSPLQSSSSAITSNLTAGETCPYCGSLLGAATIVGSSGAAYGRSQGPIQKKDFGPRFGLAYNVSAKVVLRGGAGIVYQPSAMQAAGTSGGAGDDGFDVQTNFNSSLDNQTTLPIATLYSPDPALSASTQTPFPTGYAIAQGKSVSCLASTACIQGIDVGNSISQNYFDSYRNPYSIQWNGNVQFSAPWGVKMELGYLANKGLFLITNSGSKPHDQLSPDTLTAFGCTPGASTANCALSQQVPNPFASVIGPGSPYYIPGLGLGGSTVSLAQLQHRYPQYGGVMSGRKPGGASSYNGFTFRADKNLSQGLTFTISFTEAAEYDNSATAIGFAGPSSSTYANQYNPKGEWGIGEQNVGRYAESTFIYALPFGKGRRFLSTGGDVVNKAVNGWQISGIETWSTGVPVLISGADNGTTAETLGGGPGQRPDWNGTSAKLSNPTYKHWFNTSDFSMPLSYEIGNAPNTMGHLNNPSAQNLDLQLAKNTHFGPDDRYNVQCRVEGFNAFNHHVLGSANTNVTSGQFGEITGYSNNARRFQFAAKFAF